MNRVHFLLRFSGEVSDFWESALADKFNPHLPQNSAEGLFTSFIDKLNQTGALTYLCLPVKNSSALLQKFKKQVKESEGTEYEHELYTMASIFTKEASVENIAFFDSVFPLWDVGVFQELLTNHIKYSADYSFGENYPGGLSPVIISRSLIEAFKIQDENIFLKKSFEGIPLSDYVQKNIHDFHVEIDFLEPDLRTLRLNLAAKNLRSLVQVSNIQKIFSQKTASAPDGGQVYSKLKMTFENTPRLLRDMPSYLEVELISDCEYACIFCPRQYTSITSHSLTQELFGKILSFLEKGYQDTSVCFGGMGEPLQHPDVVDFTAQLLKSNTLKCLIIETNGFYLEKLFELVSHPDWQKLRLVINLNGLKEYSKWHGVENDKLEKVKQNLLQLTEKIQQIHQTEDAAFSSIYIQILKMKDNQTEIDGIYEFCKEHKVQFLLQKYNSYVGLMPERRVSDMTPLERFPCWHLRRDMSIRADGAVSFCKQDITNQKPIGNLAASSLEDIWKNSETHWIEHFNGKFEKSPDCLSCDEYYTFNL